MKLQYEIPQELDDIIWNDAQSSLNWNQEKKEANMIAYFNAAHNTKDAILFNFMMWVIKTAPQREIYLKEEEWYNPHESWGKELYISWLELYQQWKEENSAS